MHRDSSILPEALEPRTHLSAAPPLHPLVIRGTPADDTILVESTTTTLTVTLNGKSRTYPHSNRPLRILAGGGNDSINAWLSTPTTLFAGRGNDTISISNADLPIHPGHEIHAGPGDDTLHATGLSRDTLFGESGNDRLVGSTRSTLLGGPGQDRLYAPFLENTPDRSDDDIAIRLATASNAEPFTDHEINAIDTALLWLADRAGTPRITRHVKGKIVTLIKSPRNPGPSAATNDRSAVIYLYPKGLTNPLLPAILVHEFGHLWDDESPRWNEFLDLTGWKPHPLSQRVPKGYTRADTTAEGWIYPKRKHDFFTRPYARTNPREDFATTLHSYYLHETDGPKEFSPTKQTLPKYRFIASFLRNFAR